MGLAADGVAPLVLVGGCDCWASGGCWWTALLFVFLAVPPESRIFAASSLPSTSSRRLSFFGTLEIGFFACDFGGGEGSLFCDFLPELAIFKFRVNNVSTFLDADPLFDAREEEPVVAAVRLE